MEKHELSKIDFELIDDAFKALLKSDPDLVDGEIVFEHACKLGCEGIVSKRLASLYRSGRSPHWLKIKNPKPRQ